MTPTQQGAIVLVVTLAMLLSGAPVAFGLGAISIPLREDTCSSFYG